MHLHVIYNLNIGLVIDIIRNKAEVNSTIIMESYGGRVYAKKWLSLMYMK